LLDGNISTSTADMFDTFSMYDWYILSNLLRSKSSIRASKLRMFFGSTKYVKSWCKIIGKCTMGGVEKMTRRWILKYAFFSWLPNLPENNFGTTVASIVSSYDNKAGFDALMTGVFGKEGSVRLVQAPNDKQWPHAAELMQFFIPSSIYSTSSKFALQNLTRDVPGLAKLLLFSTFVRSQGRHSPIFLSSFYLSSIFSSSSEF
jgi:hypothetical protein